jgi:hypothetical protein
MKNNRHKVLNMLDEMEEMMPKSDSVRAGFDPWMMLAIKSFRGLLDPKNSDGSPNSTTLIAQRMRPDLIKVPALKMLDDMIFAAEKSDEKYKAQMIHQGKAEKTVGQSWLVFHLRTMRSLVEEDE